MQKTLHFFKCRAPTYPSTRSRNSNQKYLLILYLYVCKNNFIPLCQSHGFFSGTQSISRQICRIIPEGKLRSNSNGIFGAQFLRRSRYARFLAHFKQIASIEAKREDVSSATQTRVRRTVTLDGLVCQTRCRIRRVIIYALCLCADYLDTFILLSCVINLLLFTYGCKLLDFTILCCSFIIVCTRLEIQISVFYVKIFFCGIRNKKKRSTLFFQLHSVVI